MTAESSGRSTLIATLRSCFEVVREVDRRHAARAELALDAVAVGERGGERGHRHWYTRPRFMTS